MKAAWTRNARKRLEEIQDYIAQDQPGNAKNFIERLINRADLAATAPDGGRVVPRYGRMDIREIFEGEYRIIYRVVDDGIEVITVRHMSRLLPKSIRRVLTCGSDLRQPKGWRGFSFFQALIKPPCSSCL